MIVIYNSKTVEKNAFSNKGQDLDNKDNLSLQTQADVQDLPPYIRKFLLNLEVKLKEEEDQTAEKIQVSQVFGGLARLYERIRNVVDYKGEHVLRRNAIERILKRLIWEKSAINYSVDERKVAENLIKELTWAHYLPNNTITESKLINIQKIISKYLYLLKNLENSKNKISPSILQNWIWGVASSEIEDLLEPSFRELYVELMFEWFVRNYNWIDDRFTDLEKETQIYIAIHRSLTKSDDAIIRYHLILREFPKFRNADKNDLDEFLSNFFSYYEKIERNLNFPGNLILYRRINRLTSFFEIFKEIVKDNPLKIRKLLKDKEKFNKKAQKICSEKYSTIRKRLRTGIIRSIMYIFITKVLFAMLIEIPYEVFFYGDVRYLPLLSNIVFPPFMMFIIGFSIRLPDEKDTEILVKNLDRIVFQKSKSEKINFSIESPVKSRSLTLFFGLIYTLLFLGVVGGISFLLLSLRYSIFGIFVFFMFLSLVILFAYRLKFNASQLKVHGRDEGLLSHVSDYVTLPLLYIGFYLSKTLSKLNFLTVLLDFFVEIPLKNMIQVFEEWTKFLREKKQEVVETPE